MGNKKWSASFVRRILPGCEGMSGGKIFQKPNGGVTYYDQITIGLYSFDAVIVVLKKRGNPSAIHCGRIIYFEMRCEDETVCLFEAGTWYILPGYEEFLENYELLESARMARDILIKKWSNPEKIRIVTDLF